MGHLFFQALYRWWQAVRLGYTVYIRTACRLDLPGALLLQEIQVGPARFAVPEVLFNHHLLDSFFSEVRL